MLNLHQLQTFCSKNTDNPFTELLALLKQHQLYSQQSTHNTDILATIENHANNAIQSLLFGIQSLGYLLGIVNASDDPAPLHTSNLGFLIQSLGNLIEALHQLKNDVRHLP